MLCCLSAVSEWRKQVVLFSFCITVKRDWLKNLAPLCHPIRSETKASHDALAIVFPPFASASYICSSLFYCLNEFKKQKTCIVFISSYKNTSGSLGGRRSKCYVHTAFSSSPKLSRVFLKLDGEHDFYFL